MIEFDFLLKKFVATFFMPISVVFILFAIGFYYQVAKRDKKGRFFIFFSIFLLFLFSYPPFASSLAKPLESQYKPYLKINKDVKYVLVLGNAHSTNKNMPYTTQLSSTALYRLVEGIRIFKELNSAKLITSGYSGLQDSVPHAVVAKNSAISLGISKEDIIALSNPKDTYEEALEVKKIVGNKKFILVTSATHILRAIEIFQSVGLNPIPAPTDFLIKKDVSFFSLPKVYYLKVTQIAMHEYLGRVWHYINSFFQKA